MKVFLTGGSGFVGQAMIRHLISQNHQVFALARSPQSQTTVRQLGAEAVSGDLTNGSTYGAELAEIAPEAVIHIAAKIEMWGPYEEFYRINVEGTRALLEASVSAGAQQFVYVSALAVVAEGKPLADITEKYQAKSLPSDAYSRTKALAEQEVLAYQGKLRTVIFRPPFIWGPNMRMIEEARSQIEKNGFPTIGERDHTLATLHVENFVSAMEQALHQPQAQGIYYLSDGEKKPLRLFLKELAAGYGLDTGNARIPRGLALTLAKTMEWVWKTFRLNAQPPLTKSMVYLMGTEFSVDDRKARRELGYQNVISIAEGMAQLRNVPS